MPPVHFAVFILEMVVSWTICSGCPSTVILLISASELARIRGVRHLAPGLFFCFYYVCDRKEFLRSNITVMEWTDRNDVLTSGLSDNWVEIPLTKLVNIWGRAGMKGMAVD
jgi:hypothetical protein